MNLQCLSQSEKNVIYKIMREDLNRMLGYNVYQEYRTQKCLDAKGGKGFSFSGRHNGYSQINDKLRRRYRNKLSISASLPGLIGHYNQDKIFFDETGLTGKVDITIQAIMNDIDALNNELKKYGLSLHYEDRQVQMLVIKDPL